MSELDVALTMQEAKDAIAAAAKRGIDLRVKVSPYGKAYLVEGKEVENA